jgi:Fe-S cluster assembly protein SufD
MNGEPRLLDRRAPDVAGGTRAERGRAWLRRHGMPRSSHEAWRYTPLAEVIPAVESARQAPSGPPSVDRSTVRAVAGDHGGPRLVFVNGDFAPALSDLGELPSGVWAGGAEGLRPRRPPGMTPTEDEPSDGFHALNWAAGRDVAAVLVDPDVALDTPIHIVHVAAPTGDEVLAHPRTVVRVGVGSRVQVIESHCALGDGAITNASTRVVAAEGAAIGHHQLIEGEGRHIHVGRVALEQAADSTVQATSLVLGGQIVRSATDVRLGGERAHVELTGLFRPTGDERHDIVVTVDHAADGGTSSQRFKGIADDRARGSFSGHVVVRPGTVGNDARQSNPNLVLRPTAQIDTRPWLEIFADDVRCTHGATVGRLDDEALFYLRSRGIPEDQARSMLVAGFAAEIVDGISPPSLRDHVVAAVELGPMGRPT